MNTPEYFSENEDALNAYIERSIERLNAINTCDEFMDFLTEFDQSLGNKSLLIIAPGDIEERNKHLKRLKEFNYPADFIEWHEKYGHIHFWIGTTKLIQTESVVSELDGDWFKLMTSNGFLVLTNDGSGNMFVWDTNQETPEISFSDHDEVYSSVDMIDSIYYEYYDLELTDSGEVESNPRNLEMDKIWNGQSGYILNSPYVKDYLSEVMEPVGKIAFLDFIKLKFKEGIAEEYSLDVD